MGSHQPDDAVLSSSSSAPLGLIVLVIAAAIISQIILLIPAFAQAKASHAVGPPLTQLLQAKPVASGYGIITDIANAGDDRLFVVQRQGIIVQTTLLPAPSTTLYLDIRSRVLSGYGEQGLLSLAFHPDYEANGFLYVTYTSRDGDSRLSRFERSAQPGLADPDSEEVLLSVEQQTPYHNLGELAFGPDGYLYVGIGDGGEPEDPLDHGQNISTLPGSVLRLDVDSAFPYAIPPDNPFVNDPDARGEIWAYGLRNPWRFSFDSFTNDLFIADVGDAAFEEINLEPAGTAGGVNYGWRCYEGFVPRQTDGCGDASLYTAPIFAYNHDSGCAVIGGHVYRGAEHPGLNGHFLFADFCRSAITSIARDTDGGWSGRHSTSVPFAAWNTLGEDQTGEVYIGGSDGWLYRIALVEVSFSEHQFLPIAWRP